MSAKQQRKAKRIEEIKALYDEGHSYREIARLLKISSALVFFRLKELRESGEILPRKNARGLFIPQDLWRSYESVARSRQTPTAVLMKQVLTTVVEDNLFLAVLED